MTQTKRIPLISWLLWYGLTGAFIYIWPSFKFGTPLWNQPANQLTPHLVLSGVHVAVGLILVSKILLGKKIRYLEVILVSGFLFGLVELWLFQTRSPYSRTVLPLTLLLSVGLQVTGVFLLSQHSKRLEKASAGTAFAVTLITYILVLTNVGGILERTSGMARQSVAQLRSSVRSGAETVIMDTAFYKLDVAYYTDYVEKPLFSGGGLAQLDNRLLLTTGQGEFYTLDLNSKPGDIETRKLKLKVPSNYYDFINEAPPSAQRLHFWFRVADIHAKVTGERVELYATYHYWKSENQTYVVRLARLKTSMEKLLSDTADSDWEVLFESAPELTIKKNLKSGLDFAGMQVGGRIQELDNNTLIFSVGDHEYDGWNFEEDYPQDPNASYGKVIKLDLGSGESEIFSTGHRNPQGLYVDPEGNIWSSEHGPLGGDEINLVKEGRNYGWPKVTFGTQYGMREWPNGVMQADHVGYEYPIYAFSTSQGLSGIIGLEKNLFPIWKGDLVVATLLDESLYRARIREGRVITLEHIPIGTRIRDIIEDDQGRIVLWTDDGRIITVKPSDQKDIAIPPVFVACAACHSVNPGEEHRIGPNLSGILNRDIASAEGFNYSPALQSVVGVWSEENLENFLQNPQEFAPESTMVSPGIEDGVVRRELIDFLESLTPP